MFDFWFPNFTCMACGAEIPNSDNEYLCSKCLQNLPIVTEELKGHYAPFYYAEPIRTMILKLKYASNGYIAKALAPYLAAIYLRLIKDHVDQPLIIPIPLHRSRQRERGYNQSLVLAQEFTHYVDVPIADNVMFRKRKTVIQKHMDATTRAANMQDAFAINEQQVATIKNRDVVLLDDVYTTGATTQTCAKLLREHGARQIFILTLATVAPC